MAGSSITHSQIPGILFPSQKLKGSCTFTTWSTTLESNEAEEDSHVKPEEEEEVESSAGEDVETSSGVGGVDQSVGYIVHFPNAVELYQRENWNCFRCDSPDHLMKDCPKDLSKTAQKVSLNMKEGMIKKGGWAPQKPIVTQPVSPDETPRAWRHLKKFPSWTSTTQKQYHTICWSYISHTLNMVYRYMHAKTYVINDISDH